MPRHPAPLPPHLAATTFTRTDLVDAGLSPRRVEASDVVRVTRGLYRLRQPPIRQSVAEEPLPGGTSEPGRARHETASKNRPARQMHGGSRRPARSSTTASTTPAAPWTPDDAAALQRLHPHLVLSHHTAARVHGFPLPDWVNSQRTLHVTSPASHSSHRTDVVTHRRPLEDVDVQSHGGLRTTSPIRTLWDLCEPSSGLDHTDLVIAADSLMRQEWVPGFGLGEIRTTRDDLERVRSRLGRFHGSRRARAVASDMREAVASPQETRTRLMLVEAGFPVPEVAYRLLDERGFSGPVVDLAWPQWRIVIQYEGGGIGRGNSGNGTSSGTAGARSTAGAS